MDRNSKERERERERERDREKGQGVLSAGNVENIWVGQIDWGRGLSKEIWGRMLGEGVGSYTRVPVCACVGACVCVCVCVYVLQHPG